MALYLKEKLENEATIAVWQITETEEELVNLSATPADEMEEISFIRSEALRKQKLAVRALLRCRADKIDAIGDYGCLQWSDLRLLTGPAICCQVCGGIGHSGILRGQMHDHFGICLLDSYCAIGILRTEIDIVTGQCPFLLHKLGGEG